MKQCDKQRNGRSVARVFSAGGFLAAGLIISFVYLLLEGLGLRSYVALLSGASMHMWTGSDSDVVLACVYLSFYLAFVILAPIFFLASLIFWLFGLIIERTHNR